MGVAPPNNTMELNGHCWLFSVKSVLCSGLAVLSCLIPVVLGVTRAIFVVHVMLLGAFCVRGRCPGPLRKLKGLSSF